MQASFVSMSAPLRRQNRWTKFVWNFLKDTIYDAIISYASTCGLFIRGSHEPARAKRGFSNCRVSI